MKILYAILSFALSISICSSAAAERPHIILIMVDDMGFSDLGYHGGEIETPNLDSLAHGGVRFSQFYNSGRCCPTRASLLTGLHPHQTGIGWMTIPPKGKPRDTEPPAYQGYLNRECVTIAEVLKESGYTTLMSGKWHLGYNAKDQWPLQRGFDKFYGCLSGATRFFYPTGDRGITLGNEPVEPLTSTTKEEFYTTDAFTDYAIQFMDEHLEEKLEDSPFFLYLAYTAPHWPLQAFEDDIAKYRGRYKDGWDHLRKERFHRQVESGLFPEGTKLSPRSPGIPDWQSLDEKKRDEMDLKMATYAAMVDRVDQNIGKLTHFLLDEGIFDDTLILFLSDNGACQEGGMLGRGEFYDREKRNLQSSNSYGEAWANVGSTPFRYYKHYVHEGGSATPFFMHWPAKIGLRDAWYEEPGTLIDIVPTLLDVAGAKYPDNAHGRPMPSLEGVSLRPAFQSKPLQREDPIFLEHETNASIRDGKWKLVGKSVSMLGGTDQGQWELYDMESDRTETLNLAGKHPDKVGELAKEWDDWADRAGVYPRGKVSPRSAVITKSNEPAKTEELKPERDTPSVGGRAFTVSATVESTSPSGVVLAQGGNAFGYSLFFENGKPAFAWRNQQKLQVIRSSLAVSGKVDLTVQVENEKITLRAESEEQDVITVGKNDGLMAQQPGLGLFVGGDGVHAVAEYEVPNRFNGTIHSHRVQVEFPKVTMRTPWGESLDESGVWSEYPRPQLRRDHWVNLNGPWKFAVTSKEEESAPDAWEGDILVPFAIEAPLSGVERRFYPGDALWYQRSFKIEKQEGKRYRLNFEAVDYESTVWVNGVEVGSNSGGNLPFSFDVTKAAKDGENEVVLRVLDATDSAHQLHGKQRLNPKGIWYTPVSGIWQTVWLEEVPEVSIRNLKITPRLSGRVYVEIDAGGREVGYKATVSVFLKDQLVARKSSDSGTVMVSIPNPRFWSPEYPNLYGLKIELGDDVVHSYVGIRETSVKKDEEGNLRFYLNDRPLFHWGTLDQGWWPDGLLTPPSDEAMVSDIEYLKAAGFNTIRKHIKVEPRRYYYHCDKIGMLVWQDQVSAMADNPEWTRLKPDPETVKWPADAHEQYMNELKLMMDLLHSHPCIVQWVPFNERWGQHQTMKVGEWTVRYDPTRQVNVASGGNFFPVGHIVDEHRYPDPGFPFELDEGRFDGFVKVMGEFGGHGFPVEGHLWSETTRNWGYGGLPKDKEEWMERYRTSIRILAELKEKGIAGGIYTQTTDVEGEINGLITYDRKVQKIDPETLREIARPLFE